jgi:hypothetical protein
MDQDWEVQKNAQIEGNTTFQNLKEINIFLVAEKAIKELKRLQNPRMVDGDDRIDMVDMEDMEHQSEDEDRVLKTMENNLSRKAKEEKIKRRCNHKSMSQFVYFVSKDYNRFAQKKNFIESNFLTKHFLNYDFYVL